MPIPEQIKVGPLRYKVMVDDDVLPALSTKSMDTLGRADHAKLVILLAKGVPEDRTRETLTHEVLHAVAVTAGLDDEGLTQEDVVTRMSPMVLSVLRDNPDLVKFLTEQ